MYERWGVGQGNSEFIDIFGEPAPTLQEMAVGAEMWENDPSIRDAVEREIEELMAECWKNASYLDGPGYLHKSDGSIVEIETKRQFKRRAGNGFSGSFSMRELDTVIREVVRVWDCLHYIFQFQK